MARGETVTREKTVTRGKTVARGNTQSCHHYTVNKLVTWFSYMDEYEV